MMGPVHSSDGTLVGLTAAAVDAFGDRDAYVEIDRRITFADYDRAADGLATHLAELGVGKGDVVCLALPTSIDYAVAYQAALRLGAITSGINSRLGAAEKAIITARLEPAVTIFDPAQRPPGPTGHALHRSELRGAFAREPHYRRPRLDPSDPVTVVWTSGTTDQPKGAVYDHRRLEAMAAAAPPMSQPGDRRLFPLPFAHSGYMTRLWDELSNGITSVLTSHDWTAGEALALIHREKVTVGQGVPTQWNLMLRHADFESTDFSAMRIAGMGGSSIPASLVREIQTRIGCPVVVRYTSTEACVTTTTAPDDPPETIATTVGKPVNGVEVRVVNGDGAEVAVGTIGAVRCRSAAVMVGYWKDPVRTAAVLDDSGWLTTGDYGFFGEDGNLRIVGRTSDMYIRGGYNVYPVQVEDVLAAHGPVAEAAVVGIPDPVLGELGAAFIVTSSPEPFDQAALRAWCEAALADYKIPDRIYVVDGLPRTAMGKIDKNLLRSDAVARESPRQTTTGAGR